MDLELAAELAGRAASIDLYYEQPHRRAPAPRGSRRGARSPCVRWSPAGRSTASPTTPPIIGARLRYLITGDPDHLAAEVR